MNSGCKGGAGRSGKAEGAALHHGWSVFVRNGVLE